jgi:hypothetical protein
MTCKALESLWGVHLMSFEFSEYDAVTKSVTELAKFECLVKSQKVNNLAADAPEVGLSVNGFVTRPAT